MRNLSNRELVDMACSATIPLIKGITPELTGERSESALSDFVMRFYKTK